MEEWKEEYKKLNIIDKIRFRWRVRQAEKAENQRQNLEHDDRQPIDRLKIATELRQETENKRNNVKVLSEYKEPIDKSADWKVPEGTVVEMSDTQKVEEIVRALEEMDGSTSKFSPDKEEKMSHLQEALISKYGEKFLQKGMEVYNSENALVSQANELNREDEERITEEIQSNSELQKRLRNSRYHPSKDASQFGVTSEQCAVFAKMQRYSRYASYEEIMQKKANQQESDLGK